MNKDNKFIGASLLFVCHKSNSAEAIIESFVLEVKARDEVIAEIDKIGRERSSFYRDSEKCRVDYLGIEDIFQVIGPISEGALLGRTTIWDKKTITDAIGLKKSESELSYLEQINDFNGDIFLATPIYFVDAANKNDCRVILCNVAIVESDYSKVVKHSIDIANSIEFKKKIKISDFEGLAIATLRFIGFEDIFVIYDDFFNGGAFQKFSREIDHEDEVKDMIVTSEELDGFFC